MMQKCLGKIRLGVLFCIKWRYLIALVAFIMGVALQLHGSSINQYNAMFLTGAEYNSQSIILGESRAVRSDEWLVNVPYYMSQTYNDFAKESHMMSIGGQDMVISANAPVLDITIIAKPFMWGYVLLGNEYGLSWFWCAKIITLLLVSFEFCMILTRRNKKVSLMGMMLLTFAPAMQWWGIIDAYIWGMLLLVLGYYFFTEKRRLYKNLCTVMLPLVAVAFALVLYPAFQLPTAMLMVALMVALLVRDKEKFSFKKMDILRIVGMAAVAIGILAYTLITSKDITYLNNSEISTFVQFAPIFLILYPLIYKKAKRDKNMIVGNVLVVCLAVMITFMLAGFPELLAKLTGFSYITRMKLTYELAATIFTIWGIDMVWRKKVLTRKSILITLAVCVGWYICFIGPEELSYLAWWQYAVILGGLMVLAYVILMGYQKTSMLGVGVLMIVCGATVNPIVHGASALLGHPLEKKIAEIAAEDKDAYWLANGDMKFASIGVANGAKVLNMVDFYPDFEKWELIDPERENEDVYNRYAHVDVVLTDGETEFKLGETRDVVALKLSCEDAKKWPIKYVIMSGELTHCEDDYNEIYKDSEGNYYIYERVMDAKKDN